MNGLVWDVDWFTNWLPGTGSEASGHREMVVGGQDPAEAVGEEEEEEEDTATVMVKYTITHLFTVVVVFTNRQEGSLSKQ